MAHSAASDYARPTVVCDHPLGYVALGSVGELMTYTVSRPTWPCCLVPALPIHTTLHHTVLSGSSSRMSSTTCPRRSRKFTWTRNPRSVASTTRPGTLSCFPATWRTRLARFFPAIRFDRRPSGTGEVGIVPVRAPKGRDRNTPGHTGRRVIFVAHNQDVRHSLGFCKETNRPALARSNF